MTEDPVTEDPVSEERGVPLSETLTRVPSRREKHKLRTRQVLREAALQLFASQGYDATTTEEIAERSGVSARTFFRYFPTKESALFIDRQDWRDSFVAAYLEQPTDRHEIEALSQSLVKVAPWMTRSRKALLLYERAVASSVTLRGRETDHRIEDLTAVANAVAQRRGLDEGDESCRLLASVVLLTHRRALDMWLAGPANADLGDAIAEEFTRLSQLFD